MDHNSLHAQIMETEHRHNVTLKEKVFNHYSNKHHYQAKNEDDYRERIDINIRTINSLKNEIDDLRLFIEDK